MLDHCKWCKTAFRRLRNSDGGIWWKYQGSEIDNPVWTGCYQSIQIQIWRTSYFLCLEQQIQSGDFNHWIKEIFCSQFTSTKLQLNQIGRNSSHRYDASEKRVQWSLCQLLRAWKRYLRNYLWWERTFGYEFGFSGEKS